MEDNKRALTKEEANDLLQRHDDERHVWSPGVRMTHHDAYINPAPMYRSGFACIVRHLDNDTTEITAVSKRGEIIGLKCTPHDDVLAWERILEGFAYKNDYRTAIVKRQKEGEEEYEYMLVVGKAARRRGPLTRVVCAVLMTQMTSEEIERARNEFVHLKMRRLGQQQRQAGGLGSLLAAMANRNSPE